MVRMEKDKHFGFYMDSDLHYKLKYISLHERRSMTGEMVYLLRQYVQNFEKENGKIQVPE